MIRSGVHIFTSSRNYAENGIKVCWGGGVVARGVMEELAGLAGPQWTVRSIWRAGEGWQELVGPWSWERVVGCLSRAGLG